MAYFYVLTFFGDKRVEYWFRESASEIVDCIEDFMYPEDEYDENMIAISLEQLNVAGGKELNDELQLDKFLYENPPNIKKIQKLARQIDKKNKKLSMNIPENPRFCKSCLVFTEKNICCDNETLDCDY